MGWRLRYREINKHGSVSRNCSSIQKGCHRKNKTIPEIFSIHYHISFNRLCRNTRLPFSRGAEKRAIRKSCGHLGVWCHSLYTSCRLSSLLGRRSTSAVCTDKSRSLWCKICFQLIYFTIQLCPGAISKIFFYWLGFKSIKIS